MIDTFQALAEPRRRAILSRLAEGELSAGAIAAGFDVTRPAISQHLAILREAGLVAERREGARRLYRLERRGLEPLRVWVDRFWSDRLDELSDTIAADHAKGDLR